MRATLLILITLVATVAGCAAAPTRAGENGPADPLAAGRYQQLGWAAGAANKDDPEKTSFFKITSVERTASATVVKYDWKNGRMELQSQVVQDLEHQGLVMSGKWHQDGASGPIEFIFDLDGRFIRGRWNDSMSSTWYAAFLR
jgi:hypothetical protein